MGIGTALHIIYLYPVPSAHIIETVVIGKARRQDSLCTRIVRKARKRLWQEQVVVPGEAPLAEADAAVLEAGAVQGADAAVSAAAAAREAESPSEDLQIAARGAVLPAVRPGEAVFSEARPGTIMEAAGYSGVAWEEIRGREIRLLSTT